MPAIKSFTRSFKVGVRRRWRSALIHAFGIIGALWTATEIATKISTAADQWISAHGRLYAGALSFCGAVRFLVHAYETRSISFLVPTTDSRVTILFGDLFHQDADWIIGVNEFFDSSVGHVVSQHSLHGQLIAKVFNGDETRFRQAVDTALSGVTATQTHRSIQPTKKYPIGTTAIVQNGSRKVFLVAMAETDLLTAKASSTVPLLWNALSGALRAVNEQGNGANLAIPLLGNGRSSVNIEPQHLMRLIVLALVEYGRKHGIPKQVKVIAHGNCFQMLDIREIKRDWSVK